MLRCTIGVMAYNEEQSIALTLTTLLSQRLDQVVIDEILVIASGCTDRTVERAEAIAQYAPQIRVVAQPTRAGKSAAINDLIQMARNEVIVLVGGDTLPDKGAIEQLVRPFADPIVGMTGGRIVPLNNPKTFVGFAVQVLWYMHHRMALRWPKLGELVAFRKVIAAIPADSATDEVALEALITEAGYELRYAPDALVYNYGPETVADFLIQRRRIFAGHMHIARTKHYIAASMPINHLAQLTFGSWKRYLPLLPLLISVVLLEIWARICGTLDDVLGERHAIWRQVKSSKNVSRSGREMRLLRVHCRAKSLHHQGLYRQSWRRNAPYMPVWWDVRQGILLCVLDDSADDGLSEHYVAEIDQSLSRDDRPVVLAYELVRFRVEPRSAPPVVEALNDRDLRSRQQLAVLAVGDER